MNKIHYVVLFLGFTVLFTACEPKDKIQKEAADDSELSLLQIRYEKLLAYPVDSLSFPRSMSLNPEQIDKVPSKDWTSGFFPGNLWQIYRLTGNAAFKEKAIAWTALMENQKYNGGTHDMGFKMYCSFGEGLITEDNQEYREILIQSAKTLCTRYNEKVGSLRSWDFNEDIWEFPVIIDNMMNLKLLFEATKMTGDSTYHHIAVKHANTTLKNHFRPDNSSYHVVVYDTLSGLPTQKVTHQGLNADSSWSRGQAWGLYGYTMAYAYTKDPAYLGLAKSIADFFMNHKNLPEDGIPYWDFDDPKIPDAPRDASAAAITASALLELYIITNEKIYLNFAEKVIKSLHSEAYLLGEQINGPFILDHSTGHLPKNSEIDVPIVYGDFYFLEALLRQKSIQN